MRKAILLIVIFHSCFGFKVDAIVPNHYAIYFDQAYNENPHISHGILEAVSFTVTRFKHLDDSGPESCVDIPRTYGVMGLTMDGKGYFRNNLTLVSELSGYSVKDIQDQPKINILAYAKAYSKLLTKENISSLAIQKHIPVLMALSELPMDDDLVNSFAMDAHLFSILNFLNDPEKQKYYQFPPYQIDLAAVFGEENFQLLKSSSVTISKGEIRSRKGIIYQHRQSGACLDYPTAISNLTTCNFSSRSGTAVSAVTIHTAQGSYAGTISWFKNCNAYVSAHYVIRSSDGQVTQVVCESNKGWHVSNDNPYTIGIEHEGYVSDSSWYTSAMYNSSADLVKDIITSGYGINPLRTFNGPATATTRVLGGCIKIKGHQHFPSNPNGHTDPGINWNWPLYFRLINDDPDIYTFNTVNDTIYDSGGSTGNYSDDERNIYIIDPGSGPFDLIFSHFDLEEDWDYLWIYDGIDHLGQEISGSPFTGSVNPGIIHSNSGTLYLEFRSDCATIASGWEAHWNVCISPVPSPGINNDNCLLTTQLSGNDYQWYLNNDPISGATDSSYFATSSGFYQVIVTNQDQCLISSTEEYINVAPCFSSIEEMEPFEWRIHPNPCYGEFVLTTESQVNKTMSIYNVSGIKILQIDNIKETVLPVSLSIAGIYFMRIKAGNDVYIKKIVVK